MLKRKGMLGNLNRVGFRKEFNLLRGRRWLIFSIFIGGKVFMVFIAVGVYGC